MCDTNRALEELEADVVFQSRKLVKASSDARQSVRVGEKSLQRIEDLECQLSQAHKQHSCNVKITHKRCRQFEESYRETLHAKETCIKVSQDTRTAHERLMLKVRTERIERMELAIDGMEEDGRAEDYEYYSFRKTLTLIIRDIPENSQENESYLEFSCCAPQVKQNIVRFLRLEQGDHFQQFLALALDINGLTHDGAENSAHVLHQKELQSTKEYRMAKNGARYPLLTHTQLQAHRNYLRQLVIKSKQYATTPTASDSDDEYPLSVQQQVGQLQHQEAQSVPESVVEQDDMHKGPRFEFAAVENALDTYEMPSYMRKCVPVPLKTIYPHTAKHVLHVAHNTEFGRTLKPGINNVLHVMESHYIDALHCKMIQRAGKWVLRCYGYYGVKIALEHGHKELQQHDEHELVQGNIVTFDNVEQGQSQFVYMFKLD